jgi:hypothetical protein
VFQLGTVRTMFHMSWSRAASISLEGWERVLHRAAQHMPVGVRIMMEVVPGRLPLCHQLPVADHPAAGVTGVACGIGGGGGGH